MRANDAQCVLAEGPLHGYAIKAAIEEPGSRHPAPDAYDAVCGSWRPR